MANESILLSRFRAIFLLTPLVVIIGLIVITEVGWRAKPQPIVFSHVLHAKTREIECRFCHRGAEKGQHAGVPSVQDCWSCHQGLIKPGSFEAAVMDRPEMRKLLTEYVETNKEIRWFKNYDLPEHVTFSHRSHVNVGRTCLECHGDVKEQADIQLNQRTSMGWCITCHRQNNAQVDCTSCHY